MKEKRYTLPEEYERTGISYSVEEFFNKLNEERTWLTNKR